MLGQFYLKGNKGREGTCILKVLAVKKPPAHAGDLAGVGLILGWGRSPGGGRGNPLQCSCLQDPTDGGIWWAAVHSIANQESDTTGAT